MKHWRVFLFVLLALLGTSAAAVIYLAPVLAAVACPSCYGLERLTPRLYVEQHIPAAKQQQLQEMLRSAEERVLQNLGTQIMKRPYILACHSVECDQRLGGKGARAVAYGSDIIRLSPRGWDPVILTHELAHIVLHEQISLRDWAQNRLPAWVDEGIAVIVSRDPRYLEISQTGQLSCKIAPDAPLPEEPRDWGREAGAGQRDIYAMAACRVLQESGSEPHKLRALLQSYLDAA